MGRQSQNQKNRLAASKRAAELKLQANQQIENVPEAQQPSSNISDQPSSHIGSQQSASNISPQHQPPHISTQQLSHILAQQPPEILAQRLSHILVQQTPDFLVQQLTSILAQQSPAILAQQARDILAQQLSLTIAQRSLHQPSLQQSKQMNLQQPSSQLYSHLPPLCSKTLLPLLPTPSASNSTSTAHVSLQTAKFREAATPTRTATVLELGFDLPSSFETAELQPEQEHTEEVEDIPLVLKRSSIPAKCYSRVKKRKVESNVVEISNLEVASPEKLRQQSERSEVTPEQQALWPNEETPPPLYVEYKTPPPMLPSKAARSKKSKKSSITIPVGRRLFTMDSIMKSMNSAAEHAVNCPKFQLQWSSEHKKGLESSLEVLCSTCGKTITIKNDEGESTTNVNDAAVWAVNSCGLGFSSMNVAMACLDVPFMSSTTFFKKEAKFQDDLEQAWYAQLKENGEIERKLAIEKGQVSPDGIPYTTVWGDGQWGKVCFNQKGQSLSGSASLFGVLSKLPLYVGVRNKFCVICAKHTKSKTEIPQHKCYKNWSGSSSGMETDIMVEAFQKSIEMHGLRYTGYIGDGDSSVHLAIKLAYKKEGINIVVLKFECKNHAIRRFNFNLLKLLEQVHYPLPDRNIFKVRGNLFGKSCAYLIQIHSTFKPVQPMKLKEDFYNVIFHVFGRHENCPSYFCKDGQMVIPEKYGSDDGPELRQRIVETQDYIQAKNSPLWGPVNKLLERLASLSPSLVYGFTSNIVESFHSTMAKFLNGKYGNFYNRGSFTRRIAASTFSFQFGPGWMAQAFRKIHQKSPGILWKKIEKKGLAARHRKRGPRARRHLVFKEPEKLPPFFSRSRKPLGDINYGPNSAQDDKYSEEEMREKVQKHIEDKMISREAQIQTHRTTIGQFTNPLFKETRKHYITASCAKTVFKMRDSTPNVGLLDNLLGESPNLNSEAIVWGKEHEEDAVKLYLQQTGKTGHQSGFWPSLEFPYVGVSPDLLVGDQDDDANGGLAEIKCPFNERHGHPIDVCQRKKDPYLKEVSPGVVELVKNHDYYFQVIMQMYVTDRQSNDFVVWTQGPLKPDMTPMTPEGHILITTVTRTEETDKLWKDMKEKFQKLVREDLIPELLDSRYERGMGYRQPQYRLDAMAKIEENRKAKENKGQEKKDKQKNTKDSKVGKEKTPAKTKRKQQDQKNIPLANDLIRAAKGQQPFSKIVQKSRARQKQKDDEEFGEGTRNRYQTRQATRRASVPKLIVPATTPKMQAILQKSVEAVTAKRRSLRIQEASRH